MDLMYSIAWTRYTNFPRSAERGNSRSTRWRHRSYGEPGTSTTGGEDIGRWSKSERTTNRFWLPNQQPAFTVDNADNKINDVAMMAWIRWHSKIDWYDVTDGSDINFETTTQSKDYTRCSAFAPSDELLGTRNGHYFKPTYSTLPIF